MKLLIERIINSPVNSNCYVLYNKEQKGCIIVDPGTENCAELFIFLQRNNLKPDYVILTHEHFDHILGLNFLRFKYNFKLITTQLCSEKITNKKKNLSIFQDQVGFECQAADLFIELFPQLDWQNYLIRFMNTPGHTSSSLSFEIDQKLFVGDLIILGEKTVTKLPSGNKKEVLKSITFLLDKYDDSIEIFSGHGNRFLLNEISIKTIV